MGPTTGDDMTGGTMGIITEGGGTAAVVEAAVSEKGLGTLSAAPAGKGTVGCGGMSSIGIRCR